MKKISKVTSVFITHGYLMIVQCKICDHPINIKADSLGNIGKHMKTHSQEQLRDLKRKGKVMVQLTLD